MATEAFPLGVSPSDAPLTPSYPPALSPGTKRATGRAETGGDSYADSPGPLVAGRWMLKRSEHLKRWNKRWVSLDATGARLTFRASPGDAKALSHVAVEDLRGASVSSVNFHGNTSYAGRCVFLERKHADPESDASRGVFLVAETPADASRWVADVRALAPPPSARGSLPDDTIRLSPAAAPPTPALVASVPRRAPASAASSSAASSASSAPSASRAESSSRTPSSSASASDAATPREFFAASGEPTRAERARAVSAVSARASRPGPVLASASSSAASAATGGGAASRWFDFAAKKPSSRESASAAELALAAEELQATASATHAQMAQMQEMTREALEAKDAALRATRESLDGARAAVAEARRRAESTQARLEEKAAEAASLRRELEDVKAAASLAADLARARLSRADAVERELGARLASAEARGDALAKARDAAEAAGKRAADALRADLEAAGTSALRAAAEAEASLNAARRRAEALERENLELERLRGWKGVFGGARALSSSSKKTRDKGGCVILETRGDEIRNGAPLTFAARASSSVSPAPVGYRRGIAGEVSGGGFVAAATAAVNTTDASTPEAVATARRRLFEYGLIAPPTPADVIQTLDSPGMHGCRQM